MNVKHTSLNQKHLGMCRRVENFYFYDFEDNMENLLKNESLEEITDDLVDPNLIFVNELYGDLVE